MTHTRLLLGSALVSLSVLALPTAALAYLSPEQVFQGITPPPTERETAKVVKDRQQQAAEARDAAHEALPSTEDAPVTTTTKPAAPAEPIENAPSLLDDEGKWERRQERLDNGNGGTTIIIQNGGEQVVRDRITGEVLHSGAPRTARTGPGDFIAAFVLFLAATGTFFWARRRERALQLILR